MNYYIGKYIVTEGNINLPIEWIELEKIKEGKSLLISKNVLDCCPYGAPDELEWKKAFICEYLEDLYRRAFTDEEKEAIVLNNERGLLFLLNEEEITGYFSSTEERRAIMYWENYREDEDGKYYEELYPEHYCYWLMAENPSDWKHMPVVTPLGEIGINFSEAEEMGVRVAMWVDTKKARIMTAKNGFNPWHHMWKPDEF